MDTLHELMDFLIEKDNYWQDVITTLISSGIIRVEDYSMILKMPYRNRPFFDHDLITNMLNGHPDMGYDDFGTTNTIFL